jgi:hypothetical protein
MRQSLIVALVFLSTVFIGCSEKKIEKEEETKSKKLDEEQRKLESQMIIANKSIDEVNAQMSDREDWNEEALIGYRDDLTKAEIDLQKARQRKEEINRNHQGLHIFGGGFYSQLTEYSNNERDNSENQFYSEGQGAFFGLRYWGLGVEYRKVEKLHSRRFKRTDEMQNEYVHKFDDLEPWKDSYEVLQLHYLFDLETEKIEGSDGYFKFGLEQIIENKGYIYRKQEFPIRPVFGFGWIWFYDFGMYLNLGFEGSYWIQDQKEDSFGNIEYDDSKIWEVQFRTEIGLW